MVESVRARRTREPPPLLFDLTSLQRTANRRFGLSAARTLEIAQALYETHKILTYPRTDSRHLSRDLAATLPKLFGCLADLPDYQPFARRLLDAVPTVRRGWRPAAGVEPRIFDDGKVHDHHAIIPTGKRIDLDALSRDERRVFDLVARRFLGAFFPDAEFAATDLVIRVGPPGQGPRPGVDGDLAAAGPSRRAARRVRQSARTSRCWMPCRRRPIGSLRAGGCVWRRAGKRWRASRPSRRRARAPGRGAGGPRRWPCCRC